MPSVFAQNPYVLWGNKKRRRRAALVKALDKENVATEEYFDEEDLMKAALGKKTKDHHPKLHDSYIKDLKKHKDYKTRTERDKEEEEKRIAAHEKGDNELLGRIQVLSKKGWSEEEIVAIIPSAAKHLKKGITFKPRIGKK